MKLEDKLIKYVGALPSGARVLDAGCGQLEKLLTLKNLYPSIKMFGCDMQFPDELPKNVNFEKYDFDSGKLMPFNDDYFDFIICQHVIEHLKDPIKLVENLLSKLKPGGILFLEAPSNYSTIISYPFSQERNLILNFYDDPTHVGRPWTPQAFHRLAHYFSCKPLECRYEFCLLSLIFLLPIFIYSLITNKPDLFIQHYWRATGWVCFAFIQKPKETTGRPEFKYFSFKGKCDN